MGGGEPSPHVAAPPAGIGATRAQAVELELGQLAAELGTGRDTALLRALAFYRKFVRRGRRFGLAPESFLRELAQSYEHRDLHAELARLREKVTALAERTAAAQNKAAEQAAAGREATREPTALEIYRAAKRGRPLPAACKPPPDAQQMSTSASASATSWGEAPVVRDGSRLAGLAAAAMSLATPGPELRPFSPMPSAPEAKSDYADRRARLPKITF